MDNEYFQPDHTANEQPPVMQPEDTPTEDTLPPVDKRESARIISITLTVAVLFFVLKMFSLGWMTIIFFGVFIVYFIGYIVSGLSFAKKPNKTKTDYLLFYALCFFFLLSGLTFCDYMDNGPSSYILKFLPYNVSSTISGISLATAFFLFFVPVFKRRHEKNRLEERRNPAIAPARAKDETQYIVVAAICIVLALVISILLHNLVNMFYTTLIYALVYGFISAVFARIMNKSLGDRLLFWINSLLFLIVCASSSLDEYTFGKAGLFSNGLIMGIRAFSYYACIITSVVILIRAGSKKGKWKPNNEK